MLKVDDTGIPFTYIGNEVEKEVKDLLK